MKAFDFEAAMVAWIEALGYSASIYPPEDASGTFVTVSSTGGSVSDFVRHPSAAIQVWGDTPEDAKGAAESILVALKCTCPPPGVHSIDVDSGPYEFNDPESRRFRYQIAIDASCQLTA